MDVHTDTNTTPSSDGPAITLTDKAVEIVKTAMQRESRGPEYALRVGVVGGGCSGFSYTMSFDDQQKADDQVIEVGGVRVLDDVSGLHGAGFKFLNPKADRTCGCGSSFSA